MSTPVDRVQSFLDAWDTGRVDDEIAETCNLVTGSWVKLLAPDLRPVLSAIAAVVALHQPSGWTFPHSGVKHLTCDECSDPENGVTQFWPCPTVAVITGALAGQS